MVRHSEVHNPDDILYGRLPRYRLSSRGKEQAEITARFLSTRPLTAIYTSPLLRARQTATILTHYHPGIRVQTSRSLLEVKTGYQGSPNSILKPGFSFYEPLKQPDDETMPQVFARMVGFLRRLARRHAGQTVAAVSHADPIAILRIGLERKALTVPNLHGAPVYPARSSVTQVTVQPGEPLAMAYFNVGDIAEMKL